MVRYPPVRDVIGMRGKSGHQNGAGPPLPAKQGKPDRHGEGSVAGMRRAFSLFSFSMAALVWTWDRQHGHLDSTATCADGAGDVRQMVAGDGTPPCLWPWSSATVFAHVCVRASQLSDVNGPMRWRSLAHRYVVHTRAYARWVPRSCAKEAQSGVEQGQLGAAVPDQRRVCRTVRL